MKMTIKFLLYLLPAFYLAYLWMVYAQNESYKLRELYT